MYDIVHFGTKNGTNLGVNNGHALARMCELDKLDKPDKLEFQLNR